MKQIYVVEQYKNQNKNFAKPLVSPVLDKLDFRVLFLKRLENGLTGRKINPLR